MVSPALEQYTDHLLMGEVWKRPDLSPRDRSIVTVSALIARNQQAELPFYLKRALYTAIGVRESEYPITLDKLLSNLPKAA